jgi:hypothetical protein
VGGTPAATLAGPDAAGELGAGVARGATGATDGFAGGAGGGGAAVSAMMQPALTSRADVAGSSSGQTCPGS